MISIVLLDCMFYLSIFFIVGGYVASLFGKLTSPMLHSFFIYAFSGLLSYKLGRISGKPQLRFLALIPVAFCIVFFTEWSNGTMLAADIICVIPATVFLFLRIKKQDYVASYHDQRTFTTRAVVVLTLICLVSQFIPGSLTADELTWPYYLVMLVSGICLLRALRQSEKVADTVRYQLLNISIALVTCVLGFFGSTLLRLILTPMKKLFSVLLDDCGESVKEMLGNIADIRRPAQSGNHQIQPTPDSNDAQAVMPGDSESLYQEKDFDTYGGGLSPFMLILLSLAVFAIVGIILFIFTRRRSREANGDLTAETRSTIDDMSHVGTGVVSGLLSRIFKGFSMSNESKVRQLFKQAVLLAFHDPTQLKNTMTSSDMAHYCVISRLNADAVLELHTLYIAARYGHGCSAAQTRRAKELYALIRKDYRRMQQSKVMPL